MFYYKIKIQFAKADAPYFTDEQVKKLIDNAIEVYNAKSLMAANPKQIVEKNVLDDMTLEVVLESTTELQESMASKALRVFSSYLIADEVDGNFSDYITGKRLFKMMPTKLLNYNKNKEETIIVTSQEKKDKMDIATQAVFEETDYSEMDTMKIDEALVLENLAKLLQKARTDKNAKIRVKRISNILENYLKKQEV